MNKILKLLDEKFVLDLFCREILPLYPEYSEIKGVKIQPYKKLIWETTYHVVFGFEISFMNEDGKLDKILVVCTAHSNEQRKNVYEALKYLWDNGLTRGHFDLPRPLFYSQEFNATFYQGLIGENLFYYIKQKDLVAIEKMVISSAKLFARLHQVKISPGINFNPNNSHIITVIPGVEKIFQEMSRRYNHKYNHDLEKMYNYFLSQEDKYFPQSNDLVLIHGDAHTENIIKTGDQDIGLIDFTDICLSDFARDLGTFMQQLEYKIMVKIGDRQLANAMKKLFLDTYLQSNNLVLDDNLQARINLYYNWTIIRTATFLFMKHENNPELAEQLFYQAKANLNI